MLLYKVNPHLTMPKLSLTPVELAIAAALLLILSSIAWQVSTGNAPATQKQQCLSAGGQWVEGWQFGHIVQLCSYDHEAK
jgi:hypothetical protein